MRELLLRLTGYLEKIGRRPRTIRRSISEVVPYLTRWYLTKMPRMTDGSFPFDKYGTPREGIIEDDRGRAFWIHRFGQDDEDDPHNHPWEWAISFILSGGYIEWRFDPKTGRETVRVLQAPAVNIIKHDTFHRVNLIGGEEAWSLFIPGPKTSSWGVIDMTTRTYRGWREYFKEKRIGQ